MFIISCDQLFFIFNLQTLLKLQEHITNSKNTYKHPDSGKKPEHDSFGIRTDIIGTRLKQPVDQARNYQHTRQQTFYQTDTSKSAYESARYQPDANHRTSPAQRETETSDMRCAVRSLITKRHLPPFTKKADNH